MSATMTAISVARDIVDAVIDIPHRRAEIRRQRRPIEHRIGDERQRLAAQRLLDQRRVDIGDPVAETLIGASAAVMHLVGMQDVTLAGQAMPALAAIAEDLHARERDADRIGVVTVRRKGLAPEMRLHPLDPVARRTEPDAARRKPAGHAVHDRSRPPSPRSDSIASIAADDTGISMAWHPLPDARAGGDGRDGQSRPGDDQRDGGCGGLRHAPIAALSLRHHPRHDSGSAGGGDRHRRDAAVRAADRAGAGRGSAAYILYLAYRIATAPPLTRHSEDAAAPSLAGGFALAVANPKAMWRSPRFLPARRLPRRERWTRLAKTAVLAVMIVVIHVCWLLAGTSFRRVLYDPLMSRIANIVFAAMLVATVLLAFLE